MHTGDLRATLDQSADARVGTGACRSSGAARHPQAESSSIGAGVDSHDTLDGPPEAAVEAPEDVSEDAFERILEAEVGALVQPGDVASLRLALDVAEASVPTAARAGRCLRSPLRLASFVVRACRTFGTPAGPGRAAPDAAASAEGLSLMWLLIETTPTSLVEFDHSGGLESSVLSAQLDAIQAALTACEVAQCYLPCPPLALMLPVDGSAGPGEACGVRLAARTYVGHLLTGCGFFVAGLDDIFSTDADADADADVDAGGCEGSGAARGEASSARTGPSVEMLTNVVSFGQALILRVCHEFGISRSRASSRGADGASGGTGGTGSAGGGGGAWGLDKDWAAVAQDVAHLSGYFAAQVRAPIIPHRVVF